MAQLIGQAGGGYGWSEIYYNPDDNTFYLENYHCGSVDIAETFYDGREDITREKCFELLITCNHLNSLLKLYNADEDAEMLFGILKSMEPMSSIADSALRGNGMYTYYLFPNNDYVIYFAGTYFTADLKGNFVCNFPVVKTILENAPDIKVIKYNCYRQQWLSEPLLKVE